MMIAPSPTRGFGGRCSAADDRRVVVWARRAAALAGGLDDRLDLAIVERATGGYVGEVVLNDLDTDNRSCSFRIALLSRAVNRGLGGEATRLILGHAFDTVGVHRVELEVFAFNLRARRVYENLGFVHEGVKRQACTGKTPGSTPTSCRSSGRNGPAAQVLQPAVDLPVPEVGLLAGEGLFTRDPAAVVTRPRAVRRRSR